MATLVNLALACGVAFTGVSSASAQDAPDFYKGKTVSLYVGSTTGGVYNVYARLLARHMGQHISGNPKILPLNMDGAGGLRLANFLYNAAPKDGTPADVWRNHSHAQMRNSEE
jgi:tripartite-type tricarboxylate transporter receptor subunit TctC